MGIPIGVALNNPLNMRPDGKSKWQGMTGVQQTGSGAFLQFADPIWGFRAAAANLIAYQDRLNVRTIRSITATWAPAADKNDPAAYAVSVSDDTGLPQDMTLNLHTYEHLKPVLVAMATVEQGASPYTWWTDAQIDEALRRAGVLAPAKPMPKGPIIAGGAAAAATAAQTAASIMPAYNPPPIVPSPSTPLPIGPGGAPDIGTIQVIWSTIAPYCKGFAIAVTIGLVGYLAWHWYQDYRKRRQGVV